MECKFKSIILKSSSSSYHAKILVYIIFIFLYTCFFSCFRHAQVYAYEQVPSLVVGLDDAASVI